MSGIMCRDIYRYEILMCGVEILEKCFHKPSKALEEQGIDLSSFVKFWCSYPRAVQEPYDFFLLKIQHFVEFVHATLPQVSGLVCQEATDLRRGYDLASRLD